DVTMECEVLATDVTEPTATDNCGGTVTVTNDASFPISTQGTTIITWTYEDENGNTSTQTQNVIIDDVSAPIADQATLADVTMECEVLATDVTEPTATDNCGGTVTVTNDASFPISTQGTTVITWTYEDENGNTSTQTQNVIIDDITAPVADQATLADINAECEVLATDVTDPTATDNCGGTVTVTNDATFPITTQGTTIITWTYEDENGNTSTQTQNINVVASPIAGVSLDDVTVTYDGSVHTVSVNNLPADASVSYTTSPSTGTSNGAIDVGTYTVTAVVSPAASAVNCDPITLTATLSIEQATQIINFDALPVMSLENDADFQLEATASSGLPVAYTYTFTAANPPATVTSTGFVDLITSGSIEITAQQPGNANYLPAAPVTQTLTITSQDAAISWIRVAGDIYDNPSNEIYYLIDCQNNVSQVEIEIGTEANASLFPSDGFIIETPVPGIYQQEITVTSQDENNTETYKVMIEKQFQFSDIITQKFDNVLLVNNNTNTNGGYRFVDYEWFKDDVLIGDDSQYYSAGPNATDKLDPAADYYVRMKTENGAWLQTCVGHPTLVNSFSANIYPNPNEPGRVLNVAIEDYKISAKNPLHVQLFTLQGVQVGDWKSTNNYTQLSIPNLLAAGVYIVDCSSGKNKRTFKLIIE
ncbi:HYR-like domain-containing protein, partial [Mesonia aestuariivivens]